MLRTRKGVTYTNGDGYYFKINIKRNGNIYMVCVDCNMRGKLVGNQLIVNSGTHCHPPDPLAEKVSNLKQNCKEESKKTLGGKMGNGFSQTCEKS